MSVQRRTFWLHSWTSKALMVSKHEERWKASRNEQWLPISQVTEVERRFIRHKLGDDRPKGAPLIIGTMIVLDVPVWLLKQEGLREDGVMCDCGVVHEVRKPA